MPIMTTGRGHDYYAVCYYNPFETVTKHQALWLTLYRAAFLRLMRKLAFHFELDTHSSTS